MSCLENETLVGEIKGHPEIWMLSHPSFRDQKIKDDIWKAIASKVGKPIIYCKKRWRNIKDTYDRKKKRKKSVVHPRKGGKKWPLEKKLSFLKINENHSGNFSNLDSSHIDEVDLSWPEDDQEKKKETITRIAVPKDMPINSVAMPISPPSPSSSSTLPSHLNTICKEESPNNNNNEERATKRKETLKSTNEAEEDDVDLFFKSLAKSVKKFPLHLQQQAKIKALEIIINLENEM